jgi:hypothetical protein
MTPRQAEVATDATRLPYLENRGRPLMAASRYL